MSNFKNLEEVLKTWKMFDKKYGNSVFKKHKSTKI